MSLLNKDKCKKVIFIVFLSTVLIKAETNYNYKKLRDPFYPGITVQKNIALETKEAEKSGKDIEEKEKTEKNEDDKIKQLELIEKETGEELKKIEVAAIMGNRKGYLVLFKEDSMIYKENDCINKDRRIKIDKIDADSVKLITELENGRKLSIRIPLKLK